MDDHDHDHQVEEEHAFDDQAKPRELPADLPRSLDDRKTFSGYGDVETEIYDAWQGTLLSQPPHSSLSEHALQASPNS